MEKSLTTKPCFIMFSFARNVSSIFKLIALSLFLDIFFLLIFLPFSSRAEKMIPDSISDLSYKHLEEYFNKNDLDTIIDVLYIASYLQKSRKDLDTLKMVEAFFQYSIRYLNEKALSFADSIIFYTRNKNYELYPERAYLIKGNHFTLNGDFENALKNYFIVHDISKKKNNRFYQITAKFNIGVLKNKLGCTNEAIKVFKEYVHFMEINNIYNHNQHLSIGLLNLADAYFFLGQYDSVEIVSKKGLNLSLSINDNYMYPNFLILIGANLYKQGKYQQAIDSLIKGEKYLNDAINKMIANLYLGKTYYAMSNYKLAIDYFNTIDSYLSDSGHFDLEILEAYPPLIEYYKKQKDYENQLIYTNKLLKYNNQYLEIHKNSMNTIQQKFDIPELLESKNDLVKDLEIKTAKSKRKILLLLILSGIAVLFIFYVYSKNRKYKKRFQELMKESSVKEKKQVKTVKTSNEIDESIKNEILEKLEKFENSDKFLNKNLTLTQMAKEIKSNSSYLSKIINEHKNGNFTHYITHLRIEYAIKQLKNDVKFRAFTIKAIAEEMGFKTAQSFSKAFHNKTGLYPSYFIKQLQKEDEE